ncbi:MAG: ComF family protein [Bacteroidota bacterium]
MRTALEARCDAPSIVSTAMLDILKNLLLPVVDFIYPPTCISCEQRLSDTQCHACTSCWDSLERVSSTDHLPLMQQGRFDEEKAVARFLSCFYFEEEGPIQRIIHGLKYGNRRSLGIELGKIVGECVKANPDFRSAAMVIAVPLHRIKFRERGYNQCHFISKGVAEVTGQVVRSDILVRTRNTASQTKLSLEEREANVGDAFVVARRREDEVRGARIILIDDVITTGATLTACAKALRDAGAAEVLAATVALAK